MNVPVCPHCDAAPSHYDMFGTCNSCLHRSVVGFRWYQSKVAASIDPFHLLYQILRYRGDMYVEQLEALIAKGGYKPRIIVDVTAEGLQFTIGTELRYVSWKELHDDYVVEPEEIDTN